jgi:Protein of unknown function (DUF5132)
MAFIEDMFKGGNIFVGLAVGLGAAVVAPAVIPILRPLAKSVIKAGLIAYDQGKVALAEFNEQAGDMIAEAREEIAHVNNGAGEGREPATGASAPARSARVSKGTTRRSRKTANA